MIGVNPSWKVCLDTVLPTIVYIIKMRINTPAVSPPLSLSYGKENKTKNALNKHLSRYNIFYRNVTYTRRNQHRYTRANFNKLYNLLCSSTDEISHHSPHPHKILAYNNFRDPYPLYEDIDLLSLACMDLLIQFAYPRISGYAKFTIVFTLLKPHDVRIEFTIGCAIPLTYQDDSFIPKTIVYSHIEALIRRVSEIYDGVNIDRITIRVFVERNILDWKPISEEEREKTLLSIFLDMHPKENKNNENVLIARRLKTGKLKRSYPTHITSLKEVSTPPRPFIVADIETLLIDNIHMPYAAGLMEVSPGENISNKIITTYFSEEYSLILDSFEDRSQKVLFDFVKMCEILSRKSRFPLTVYFHNFSRFDGIILLKHLVCHHNYQLKPLMRNSRLYEVSVYSNKRKLFRFRDSLNLLPGKLVSLAQNLCPNLGTKGSIDHSNIKLSNLLDQQEQLLDYMKQDIRLLGGVMVKAQEIYMKLYNIDIERELTHSSLALKLFRTKYLDSNIFHIHIPNRNEDSFIRRGYYGGHVDAYLPYGENLKYYDVNSLYPFVMKEFPMPDGPPVWHRNLEGQDLNNLFGFIEAYVECPKTIKKPFLPYRGDDRLIFPTGRFVGVYFSEELKYARQIGYTVIPISGYLFKKKESPFKEFVSSLYESRLEAKKDGNEALSYVYKIIMNSLYGRFGINPKSTTTELCDENRYKELIRHSDLIFCDMISNKKYIVAYHSNTDKGYDYWNPPKNSAVQIAAAITAYARIYMYPFISRDDCFYTDTDSVVLGGTLPADWIDSSIGKFKLENSCSEGVFLGPKVYCIVDDDGNEIIKYKGQGKAKVYKKWFFEQYNDPTRTEKVEVVNNFRVNYQHLNIFQYKNYIELKLPDDPKRKSVYREGKWIDSEPIEINDLSCLDQRGQKIVKSLSNQIRKLKDENSSLNERLSQKERERKEDKGKLKTEDNHKRIEGTMGDQKIEDSPKKASTPLSKKKKSKKKKEESSPQKKERIKKKPPPG